MRNSATTCSGRSTTGAFVPHQISLGSDGFANTGAPGRCARAGRRRRLLVNLSDRLPSGLERFARVAEIIDADPQRRRLGRERFKSYRDRSSRSILINGRRRGNLRPHDARIARSARYSDPHGILEAGAEGAARPDFNAAHAAVLTETLKWPIRCCARLRAISSDRWFERLFDRLRTELPALVDRVMREHSAAAGEPEESRLNAQAARPAAP